MNTEIPNSNPENPFMVVEDLKKRAPYLWTPAPQKKRAGLTRRAIKRAAAKARAALPSDLSAIG